MRRATPFLLFVLAALFFFSISPARAQGANDADNIILRLRSVCNYGQGGDLIIAFEIKARGGGGQKVLGGYSIVLTYVYQKIILQDISARYQTQYWDILRNFQYGAGAYFVQQAHPAGIPGNALPLNSTYFSAATDCNGVPLPSGWWEILRFRFTIQPTANGTVDFGMYDVLPYRAGQAYQDGNLVTATFYAGLQNNSNDSLILIKDLTIPIDLHAFDATALTDGSVRLTWTTESETSNVGFDVERGDGETFERIGFVPGNGTTSGTHSYAFVDPGAKDHTIAGRVFYRLRQVDADGTDSYSVIASAVPVPESVAMQPAYPNPSAAATGTTVPYTLAVPATVDLSVYNSLGEKVATLADAASRDAGGYVATWNGTTDAGSAVPTGVYVVRFDAALAGGEHVRQSQRVSIIR